MILYTDLKEHKKKTIIIPESKLHLLSEALTDVVFHYTTLSTGLKIVNTDTIYLQSALGGTADNMKRKELYYLSLTRQRNANFGYSYKFRKQGVRIEFDGQKLSQRFKGQAIDYWGSSMGKMSYYTNRGDDFNDTKQHHTDAESEDRMFSNKPTLYDAHKYIKRIDVIFDPKDENQFQYVYHMLMSSLNKIIFVYDNENDFNKQSDNTLNRQIYDNHDNFSKYYNTKPNNSDDNTSNASTLSKILKFMFSGEVDANNVGKEASKLLKQYGLEKYINGQLINAVNDVLPFGGIKTLIDDISNDMSGLSSHPNEERQKIVKLFTDYFKKNGFKTYADAYKHKVGLGMTSEYDSDQVIDKEKEKTFLTYKGSNFNEVLIPNPDKTSFWQIISDKEQFIEDLYYYAVNQYGYDEQDKIKHKSKDNESFYKYLQYLAKKNVSVSQMLGIINKLGLNDEEKKQLFNFGTFQYENLKFFQAKSYRLPQFINSKDFYYGQDSITNTNQIRKYYFK